MSDSGLFSALHSTFLHVCHWLLGGRSEVVFCLLLRNGEQCRRAGFSSWCPSFAFHVMKFKKDIFSFILFYFILFYLFFKQYLICVLFMWLRCIANVETSHKWKTEHKSINFSWQDMFLEIWVGEPLNSSSWLQEILVEKKKQNFFIVRNRNGIMKKTSHF